MTVAVILLAYAACVGTLGSRILGRARWTTAAPLLGIITYLAAAWSVVASLGLAGLSLAVHATALGGGLSQLIGACVLRLRAAYATPGGATVAGLGLSSAGALLVRTAITAAAHLRAVRRHAIEHVQAARIVGHRDPVLGAVLVDHAQPTAYCVGGPHPTVIVTTGALRALNAGQLAAVLAHERAHLAGHHHRLLALARIGHRVLPFIPLMRDAAAQIERLVEMHADDAATADHDARPLATALVLLATGAGPALGLAAASTDAVQRIQRLLGPAEPLSRARRGLLRAGAVAVALVPVLLALAPAVAALALGRVPAG
jgi:Zn-dependent protease with chaperone function